MDPTGIERAYFDVTTADQPPTLVYHGPLVITEDPTYVCGWVERTGWVKQLRRSYDDALLEEWRTQGGFFWTKTFDAEE